MAGKFLTIDETATRLGVDVDEVNRLVDSKQLFPMRDGATLKFKADDVTRLAEERADEMASGDSGTLQLDLDAPAGGEPRTGSGLTGAGAAGLGLGDELGLGDLTFEDEDVASPAGAAAGPAGEDDRVSLFDEPSADGDATDLLLESVVSASSPALPADDDALVIEDLDGGTVELPGAAGPAAGGGLSDISAIGAALSGPLESGLSLEGGDVPGSGIDLEIGSGIGGGGAGASGLGLDLGSGIGGSGVDLAAASGIGSGIGGAGGSLVGESFDLGDGGEDGSSVAIATDSGDSSFFGDALGDSASVSFDESSIADSGSIDLPGMGDIELTIDTTFSAWQIVGLVCCSLLLMTGLLVMLDLVWTIRSSGQPYSAPLIQGLAQVFGWG
jgi:excisionase family DNA binding protein